MPFYPNLPQQVVPNGSLGLEAFEQSRQRAGQNQLIQMQLQRFRDEMKRTTDAGGAMADYIQAPDDASQTGALANLARANPTLAANVDQQRQMLPNKKLKQMKGGLEYGLTVLPHVPFEMYPAFRQDMQSRGLPVEWLPEGFGDPQQYEAWKRNAQMQGMSLKERLDMQLRSYDLDKPSYHTFQEGDESVTTRWTPRGGEQELGRGPKWADKGGIEVDLGDGKTVRIGGRGATDTGMQKPTANEVEKDLKSAADGLSQMLNINKVYKREYQTVPWKAKVGWEALKSKWSGQSPPESEAAKIKALSEHRSVAGRLFAQTMKDMSGVAINAHEAARQEAYLPTPGNNWWEGDSPEEFESKTASFINFQRRAIARLNLYRKKGFSIRTALKDGTAPELDSPEVKSELGEMMQQRAVEIETSLDQAGMARGSDENKERTLRQLAEEFGVMY